VGAAPADQLPAVCCLLVLVYYTGAGGTFGCLTDWLRLHAVSIYHRFHSNEFSNEFMSTIGVEFVTKKIEINGRPVKLQIWDTAGQERYASMMKTYYRKAKVGID
jgi:hypothetical protein